MKQSMIWFDIVAQMIHLQCGKCRGVTQWTPPKGGEAPPQLCYHCREPLWEAEEEIKKPPIRCPIGGFDKCAKRSCGFWFKENNECSVAFIATALGMIASVVNLKGRS